MQKPQNMKGMRDHLPPAMLLRQFILNTLTALFEQHGFEPLATPVVEYAETLEGKLGDDEKLMYRFEDHGGRKVALRYDQTVPLARVVAQYAGQITLPWRRYAIGASYRGERPARGRYREFWQADIDIVGSRSPIADAEIIAMLCKGLTALGFTSFTTLVSHRQVLGGIARVSGLSDDAAQDVYRAIDKFDKIGADGVYDELLQHGVATESAQRMLALIALEGTTAEVLQALRYALTNDADAMAALDNLATICAMLDAMGVPAEHYTLAPRLARGLSYYTGVVFEAISSHWPHGSLLGGGRYDNLVGMFAGRPVPTVGLAFGIDRLHDVMDELHLFPHQRTTTADVFVTLFDEEHIPHAFALANELRDATIPVAIALDATHNLGKQFKEAHRKGISYVVVVGPDELAHHNVQVKNLITGEQQHIARDTIVSWLQKQRAPL